MKPFKDLVVKGKTLGTHLESEEGRGLMRWLIKREIKDDKFADWAIKRNNWLREQLELHVDDPQVQEESLVVEDPKLEQTAMEAMAFQIKNHEDRIKQLESCIMEDKQDPTGWPEEV